MEVTQYQRYRIELKNRRILSIEKDGYRVKGFEQPATNNKLPKLYVVKSAAKVIYIGVASQSMRSRLRNGLEAKGKGGYYGYKWKDLAEVDILIWCFPQEKLNHIEAIEAELVYLIRKNTGEWPAYQTEIHFHNILDDEVEIVRTIFDIINNT